MFAEAQSTSKRMERERGKRRRRRRRSPLHSRSLFAPSPSFVSLFSPSRLKPKEGRTEKKGGGGSFCFSGSCREEGGGRKRLRGRERRKTRSGGWRGYKIFAVRKLRGWSKTSPVPLCFREKPESAGSSSIFLFNPSCVRSTVVGTWDEVG